MPAAARLWNAVVGGVQDAVGEGVLCRAPGRLRSVCSSRAELRGALELGTFSITNALGSDLADGTEVVLPQLVQLRPAASSRSRPSGLNPWHGGPPMMTSASGNS